MDLLWKVPRRGGAGGDGDGEGQDVAEALGQARWLHRFYYGTPQPYLSWWQAAQVFFKLSGFAFYSFVRSVIVLLALGN